MAMEISRALVSLHVGTLFVVAICVTLLLGLVLLAAWAQERIPTLAWWSAAYLMGGLSGVLWQIGDLVALPLSADIANVLLFVAVGMIWSAARMFHGRPVRWSAQFFGAAIWQIACVFPAFAQAPGARIVASALIVAGYTFLIATELRHERRKSLLRRWPALFVPTLHGAIFLFPVGLAALSPGGGTRGLAGWVAVFAIEIVLYVIGAAFMVLILAKDRAVRRYKIAAETDPLTGVLNRRGFLEAAAVIMTTSRRRMAPVSVLAFDLDHFKSINDRFGHHTGDATLQTFATVARKSMRADDIIGRLGGEEFVAILGGTLADAAVVAERVRSAFAAADLATDGGHVAATVSIGVACGSPLAALDALLVSADEALYRAKKNGRNRVETADQAVAAITGHRAAPDPGAASPRRIPAAAVAPATM